MANEDYTSLVPHYTFADTLEEQEAQLETNPLMQRLNAYRKTYEGDPHRPIYHYINPEAMLNDPNGLCFCRTDGISSIRRIHPKIHVSTGDTPSAMTLSIGAICLMQFTQIPKDAAFSGATLVEEGRVIAMYHERLSAIW